MIESTGDGLVVVISCKYIPCHNWMSFVSWFSIKRNLPDAKSVVLIERGIQNQSMFGWLYKWYPSALHYTEIDMDAFISKFSEEVVVIKPHIMAVRDYQGDVGPASAQSDQLSTFVNYSERCGRFVTSEWIDRCRAPFKAAVRRFDNNELTANELKVLKLWEESSLFVVAP